MTESVPDLIRRVGGVSLGPVGCDATPGRLVSVSPELSVVAPESTSNGDLVSLKKRLASLLDAEERIEHLCRENELLTNHLSVLLSEVADRSADESTLGTIFEFAGLDLSYAVIRDGAVLFNRGVDAHSVIVEARRMEHETEHSCAIAMGERFVYACAPYMAIIDSPEPLDVVVKQLIRLTMTDLASKRRQRDLHELIERLYRMFNRTASLGLTADRPGTPPRESEPDFDALDEVEGRFVEVFDATLRDSLTQTYNRAKTDEMLAALCAGGRMFSVLIIDIDHFKSVNDTFGHLAGDRVIVDVATTLERTRRVDDIVARWGGEEFVVLLPRTSLDRATEVAERMRIDVERFVHVEARSITCSFGVAEHRPGETPEDLFARADEAMYAAKSGGRNRVERASARTPDVDLTGPISDSGC